MELSFVKEELSNQEIDQVMSQLCEFSDYIVSIFHPYSLTRFHEMTFIADKESSLVKALDANKSEILLMAKKKPGFFHLNSEEMNLGIISIHLPKNRIALVVAPAQEIERVTRSNNCWELFDCVFSLLEKINLNRFEIKLSRRENQCVNWLVEGKTTWEIATILNVSERTACFHVNNIINKTQSVNRNQALAKILLAF